MASLPLTGQIGEQRTITDTITIDELIEVAKGFNKTVTVATLTREGLAYTIEKLATQKAALISYLASLSSFFLDEMLSYIKKKGTKGLKLTYTYEFRFLYGDPTTLPRWTAIDVKYTAY